MKRHSKKKIFLSGCAAICTFALYLCWAHLATVERFIYSFDEALSESITQEMAAYLDAQVGQSADVIITNLCTQFPCVSQVNFTAHSNKEALLTILAYKPIVRINENQLLVSTAHVIPITQYKENITLSIAQISADDQALADEHECMCMVRELSQLDQSLLEKFQLTWRNHNEVVVLNKDTENVEILCCAYQLADRMRFEQSINQISTLITDKSEKKLWLADIRFDKQVILRSTMGNAGKNKLNGNKGGIQHGTYIS